MTLLHAVLIPEERYKAEKEEYRDDFDCWEEEDFVVNVLYDAITDRIVFHEDNINDHPQAFIAGYIQCLRNRELSYNTHKAIIILPQGVDEYNYIAICPYVRAYIESLEN